jgi:hypothetical protein
LRGETKSKSLQRELAHEKTLVGGGHFLILSAGVVDKPAP